MGAISRAAIIVWLLLLGPAAAQQTGPATGPVSGVISAPVSPGPWIQLPWITTNAGSATTVLAAGTACRSLRIVNLDAALPINIRWDGGTASSSTGKSFAPGAGLYLTDGQVPTALISVYAAAAVQVSVSYQPC